MKKPQIEVNEQNATVSWKGHKKHHSSGERREVRVGYDLSELSAGMRLQVAVEGLKALLATKVDEEFQAGETKINYILSDAWFVQATKMTKIEALAAKQELTDQEMAEYFQRKVAETQKQ